MYVYPKCRLTGLANWFNGWRSGRFDLNGSEVSDVEIDTIELSGELITVIPVCVSVCERVSV